MKELRLLRPLFVSAPPCHPPPNISSSLHTTSCPSQPPPHSSSSRNPLPLTLPRHLAPCTHPQPSTNVHKDTKGKQLPLLSAPALSFFPSNPPTSCFRPACKLWPKAGLPISGFLGRAGEEAGFIFSSYEAISTERRRAYVFGALLDEESRNLLFPPVVANYGSGG